MTRRRVFLVGTAACLLAATPFVVNWATTPAPGVTLENFKRLHTGMTLGQVQAIMGRPPDQTEVPYGGCLHIWQEADSKVVISQMPKDIEGGRIHAGSFWQPPDAPQDAVAWLSPPPSSGVFATVRRWFGM